MIKKIRRLIQLARKNKQEAKNFLSNVPEDKVFWVNDGRVLRNLNDLSTALGEMSDETFHYHVNKEKNDFKNWVLDVIGDKKLASEIENTKSRSGMQKKVSKRVSHV